MASLVYPVPLDPGNLSALDPRVVKWQVATPSHVRPSRVPGKVDTPKPRLLRRTHVCPDEIKFGVLLGQPLTRDGGFRFKGVNFLKSSEDLWGPVRWQSRLDPFPYSKPLTNLAS
ncbi:hypothetical protein CRG98_010105 [Punica granatum]|uniref:Uncharacterized protein n=1 Tax=Punica granatum TaxID=22663 RepID=A0A2I0KLX5_PUNGR|nr:hypothetical protein CRG98_010105 [Punica granatum]